MRRFFIFRIIALLFFFALLIPCVSHLSVSASEDIPSASGVRYAYLYNIEYDKVIFQKGSVTDKISPAATVKIMSGLIAIKSLGARLDENVTITYNMIRNVEGYTVGFKVGDTVKVRDVLYGLVCGGGNDAAFIVAHLCSGSVEAFVEEMNAEAKAIGMENTVYKNVTGIDEHGMVITVKDIALLSTIAIKTPMFVEMSSATEYRYKVLGSDEERVMSNRNALISNYSAIGYKNKYVKGLNSGMTSNGGYCLSAYATDEKNSLLCIVMGGEVSLSGKISSYTVANELIDYGLNNFEYIKIASKGDRISSLPVDLALPTNGSQTVMVDCVLDRDVYAYTSKNIDYKQALTYKVYFHNDMLVAPVEMDKVVGGVGIFYEGECLSEAKLVAAESVKESQLLVVLKQMKDIILSRRSILFIVTLITFLTVFFLIRFIKRKRKYKKNR